MSVGRVEPRYHSLKVTPEGFELAQLKNLIRDVKADLATLEAERDRREALMPGSLKRPEG